MEKLFSIVSKLSAKRFAKLHSDWPKLLWGSHALVSGHTNAYTPKICQLDEGHRLKKFRFNFTK